MTKKKYDFVCSIGEACSCAQSLISANLRTASGPFDWLWGSDFLGRIKILCSDFHRFIEKDDLISCDCNNGDTKNLCDIYKNKYTNLVLNHDFPAGVPLDDSYDTVAEKYERRINRLLSNINSSESVLLVYIETPITDKHTSNADIIEGSEQIKNRWSNKTIDILYFKNDLNLTPKQYELETLSNNIIKITANYKSQNPDAVSYAIDTHFVRDILRKYVKLNLPLSTVLGRYMLKFLIKFIPSHTTRVRLRKKWHLK